jgi:hypothetical protein
LQNGVKYFWVELPQEKIQTLLSQIFVLGVHGVGVQIMQKITVFMLICIGALCLSGASRADYQAREGDIIFHTSTSTQSLPIQLATHSRYSHMGIVTVQNGKAFVLEAIQPVTRTPLAAWIRRGKQGHYVVKRLRDADVVLTPKVLQRMQSIGARMLGKNYDLYFEWNDTRIYCSELVWKIYDQGAGVQIAELQTLSSFDLSDARVQAKLRERYGKNLPLSEKVISPAAMFEAQNLVMVFEN